MTALGLLILFFFTVAIPAMIVTALVKSMGAHPKALHKALAVMSHALFCMAVLLFFNSMPGFFEANDQAYKITGDITSFLRGRAQEPAPNSRRFVLIDNSGNKSLVPDPLGDEADSTVVVITDRAKLAVLLQRLAMHQERIAQVVCDITFEYASPDDSLLRASILGLAAHRKIILARGAVPNCPALSFNDDIMADATEELQEGRIAWHRLVKDGRPGIPYALYLRLNGLRSEPLLGFLRTESDGRHRKITYPGFMPSWNDLPTTTAVTSIGPLAAGKETRPDVLPLPLGFANGSGWPLLLSQLDRAPGRQPIVFIGEFPLQQGAGADKDVHHTFRGDFRGGHLLMALFAEVANDAHVLKWLMLAFEFGLFVVVSFLVFRRAWLQTKPIRNVAGAGSGFKDGSAPRPPSTAGEAGSWSLLWSYLKKKALDQRPLALFLIAYVVIDLGFRQHSNLAAPFAYFLALNALFGLLEKTRQCPATSGWHR